MFDIGFLELVLVGIVALLVLGPERLPHAARMTGAFLGRMSRMVQSVRDEVEREVNIHEMQQRIKKQVEEGMIGDIKQELAEANKAIQEGFNATRPTPNSSEAHEAVTLQETAALHEPIALSGTANLPASSSETSGNATPSVAPAIHQADIQPSPKTPS